MRVNMRAMLIAQIAGQIATRWRANGEPYEPNISVTVDTAEAIVSEVERRLGEPIYHSEI